MAAAGHDVTCASPRSPKGARTRARLVEAGRAVFEEQGLLDARIAAITERAGVSYGAFYHYFDSKESLFREVAGTADARLRAPLDEVILARDSEVSPQDRLREAIRRHFEAYRDNARLLGVIEQVARIDEQVGTARDELHREDVAQVADSIRLLQRRGLADRALDPTVAAAALGAMSDRFAELWLANHGLDCDFETGVDTFTRLFVNALGLTAA